MKEEIKFKLGDRVYAPFHGYGVVTAIHEDACVYPIEVTWDDSGLKNMEDASTFTADGLLSKYYANTDTILTVVKGSHLEDADRLTVVGRSMPEEEEKEVSQIAYSVINPAHYRVEGIPEAIEIMKHLMAKEQLEGFLWGNILKYAYRYGRKGDKAETAGKIAWYAQKLKECESK